MRSNTHLRYVEIESHHDPLDAREEEGRSHFIFPEIKYSLVAVNFTWLLLTYPPLDPMRVALSVRESTVFMGFFAAFPRKLFFLFLVNLPSFLGHNLNWPKSQGSHNFPKCKYIDPYVLLSRAKWTNKARNSGIKDV